MPWYKNTTFLSQTPAPYVSPHSPHPHADVPDARFGRFLSSRFCFASRLDLTVPSSPIKSEALREECAHPVSAALPTKCWCGVSAAMLLFSRRLVKTSLNTDWCSLEPADETLPLTLTQWTVDTVSSACQQPLFLWVVADYHLFMMDRSGVHMPQCALLPFCNSLLSLSSIIIMMFTLPRHHDILISSIFLTKG